MRKGTNEEGMYVWTESGKEGREEASGGGREQRSEGKEHGRKGDRKGGKLQGRYHEEDTDKRTKQHTTRPLDLVPNWEPERSRVTI